MTKLIIKHEKWNRGQALIELTLLLPLLVLILLGTIDFGRVFFQSMALAQAARAGAQYGAQSVDKSSDTAGMQGAAVDAGQDIGLALTDVTSARRYFLCGGGDTNEYTVEPVSPPCGDGKPAMIYVEVTVQKTFTTMFNYPGFPHSINLNRTARIRAR
ncbi:MAG TPA: TadE/TadG family type IV pilus assembly protein [Candidatus Binatia bacterium]|nr:TadE/TadG family type IV pilus assembly protein [Candidatus Binatia bacterium]